MPILAIDHNGNLIESDPNRSDGKGAKGPVRTVRTTALTIGDAHGAAQNISSELNARLAASQAAQNRITANARNIRRNSNARIHAAHALADEMNRRESVQNTLIAEGIRQTMMGCDCESNVNGVTGNGLTSNGMPMPANTPVTIQDVDYDETKAEFMKSAAFNELCQRADYNARQVSYDNSNAAANVMPVDNIQTRLVKQMAPRDVAVTMSHPMSLFFVKR